MSILACRILNRLWERSDRYRSATNQRLSLSIVIGSYQWSGLLCDECWSWNVARLIEEGWWNAKGRDMERMGSASTMRPMPTAPVVPSAAGYFTSASSASPVSRTSHTPRVAAFLQAKEPVGRPQRKTLRASFAEIVSFFQKLLHKLVLLQRLACRERSSRKPYVDIETGKTVVPSPSPILFAW